MDFLKNLLNISLHSLIVCTVSREIWCNSSPCYSIGEVFFLLASFKIFSLSLIFLHFEYNIPRYIFIPIYLSYLVSSKLSSSLLWCLWLILENSQSLLLELSLLFLSFFPFSLWYSHYAYVIPFIIVPQFWGILFYLLSFFFLFAFQFWKFLLTFLHVHWLFPWLYPAHWWALQKHFSFLL